MREKAQTTENEIEFGHLEDKVYYWTLGLTHSDKNCYEVGAPEWLSH